MGLHEDVARGDIDAVVRALHAGGSINAREPVRGYTPLMSAVTSPRAGLPVVRWLIEHGADVQARSWTAETMPTHDLPEEYLETISYQLTGDTALTLAAANGDLELVMYLLDAGADIDATTSFGYDALIHAVYAGAQPGRDVAPLVAVLLHRGAVADRATTYGETPLGVAARFALFDIVKMLLDAGADAAALRWTPLHTAVVFGTLGDVQTSLNAGCDLEARDAVGRTALHLSLQIGDIAKADLLRQAGASLTVDGDHARSALSYAIDARQDAAVRWLLVAGIDAEEPDRSGMTPLMQAVEAGAIEVVRQLLDAGVDVARRTASGETAISRATDMDVGRMLVEAGADLNESTDELRKALFGFPPDGVLMVSHADYQAGKTRRFGATNPDAMDVPLWREMIRTRAPAYAARSQFADTDTFDTPVWCFDRFGRTLTTLPDGRYVEIGGEHEDYYDPDFCIYNDVVVYDGNGRFTLYGYPETLFPPTDFHTATRVGHCIYLIGSLGYQGERRPSETPVYCLRWDTWQIEPIQTHGEVPGWISRHTAVYDATRECIVVQGGKRIVQPANDGASGEMSDIFEEQYVDNTFRHALHLPTMRWSREDTP